MAAAAVSLAIAAGVPTARVDYVASPEKVRAMRQKLAKSPPTRVPRPAVATIIGD
jgi:hypothetical protein